MTNRSHKVLERVQWENLKFSSNAPLVRFIPDPLVPCRTHRIVRYVGGWGEWIRREDGYHGIPSDYLKSSSVVSQWVGSTRGKIYLYRLPRCDNHGIWKRTEYLDGMKEAEFQKEIRHGARHPGFLLSC